MPTGRVGSPLYCCLRYFDPAKRRANLGIGRFDEGHGKVLAGPMSPGCRGDAAGQPAIRHDGIVRVFDIGIQQNELFMVFELIEGGTADYRPLYARS